MKAWIESRAASCIWRQWLVLALSPIMDELPGVSEVRRAEDGIRTCGRPAEYYHSFL